MHNKSIGMISTDSGRSELNFSEKNDCTVRALAEALEIPYLTAYGMMLGSGRKRNRGVRSLAVYNTVGNRHDRPNMTVENYVKYIANSGNWIINIRGHVFAVVNGVIKDLHPEMTLNCHVIQSWRIIEAKS